MGPGPQRMRSGDSDDTGRKRPGFSESMVVDLDKQQLGLSVSFASKADLSIMVATVTDRQKVGHTPRI